MNDHLTLKKVKSILPREAYERVVAADVVHKITGENLFEKLRCGIDRDRLDSYSTDTYLTSSRTRHQRAHGLNGGNCDFARAYPSRERDVGKGRLSHFHVNDNNAGRFADKQILGDLVVPKVNLHLVGPVLAELNHIYVKQRAEWERSGKSRRNRIRNVRRLRGLRKLCWPIPRKHLELGSTFSKSEDRTFRLRSGIEAELRDTSSYAPLQSLKASEYGGEVAFSMNFSKLRHRRIYRKLLAVIAEERAWEIKEGGK